MDMCDLGHRKWCVRACVAGGDCASDERHFWGALMATTLALVLANIDNKMPRKHHFEQKWLHDMSGWEPIPPVQPLTVTTQSGGDCQDMGGVTVRTWDRGDSQDQKD